MNIVNYFWVLQLGNEFVCSMEPIGPFKTQIATSCISNAIKFWNKDDSLLSSAKLFYPEIRFVEVEATYLIKE